MTVLLMSDAAIPFVAPPLHIRNTKGEPEQLHVPTAVVFFWSLFSFWSCRLTPIRRRPERKLDPLRCGKIRVWEPVVACIRLFRPRVFLVFHSFFFTYFLAKSLLLAWMSCCGWNTQCLYPGWYRFLIRRVDSLLIVLRLRVSDPTEYQLFCTLLLVLKLLHSALFVRVWRAIRHFFSNFPPPSQSTTHAGGVRVSMVFADLLYMRAIKKSALKLQASWEFIYIV